MFGNHKNKQISSASPAKAHPLWGEELQKISEKYYNAHTIKERDEAFQLLEELEKKGNISSFDKIKIDLIKDRHLHKRSAVPRLPIENVKENPISKRVRRFDNSEIAIPRPDSEGVYINTNEYGVKETQQFMNAIPRIAQGCHFGFSGWHNFDIIAQRQSSRAIICDLNPENALFLSGVLKILRTSSNRNDFIKAIMDFVTKYGDIGQKGTPFFIRFSPNISEDSLYQNSECVSIEDEIPLELKRETSWLYTEEGFKYIKKLAEEDKIALITENICNSESFSKIARLLQENSIQIDSVYVSNIAQYCNSAKTRSLFITTLQCLLKEDNTILIDAPILVQRAVLTKDLRKTSVEAWFNEEKKPNNDSEPAFKLGI